MRSIEERNKKGGEQERKEVCKRKRGGVERERQRGRMEWRMEEGQMVRSKEMEEVKRSGEKGARM